MFVGEICWGGGKWLGSRCALAQQYPRRRKVEARGNVVAEYPIIANVSPWGAASHTHTSNTRAHTQVSSHAASLWARPLSVGLCPDTSHLEHRTPQGAVSPRTPRKLSSAPEPQSGWGCHLRTPLSLTPPHPAPRVATPPPPPPPPTPPAPPHTPTPLPQPLHHQPTHPNPTEKKFTIFRINERLM